MARETGLEPATSTVTGWHSNQLSYSPASFKLRQRYRCIKPALERALYKITFFLNIASF